MGSDVLFPNDFGEDLLLFVIMPVTAHFKYVHENTHTLAKYDTE